MAAEGASRFHDAFSGDDLSRLVNMTDGVFGFAITFLVVNLIVRAGSWWPPSRGDVNP